MKSILKDIIDRHAQFVTKHVKGKKSPWMSKEIKHHMNIHDQLYRKSRKSKSNLIGFHINSNVNSSKTKSKEPKETLSPEN